MQLDGNPFEMWTIVVGIVSTCIRPIRRLLRHKSGVIVYRDLIIDFFSGMIIVPLLVLIGAVFSQDLLLEAIRSEKVYFAAAGIVSLLFVLRELGTGD